jgi:hypothetical protein
LPLARTDCNLLLEQVAASNRLHSHPEIYLLLAWQTLAQKALHARRDGGREIIEYSSPPTRSSETKSAPEPTRHGVCDKVPETAVQAQRTPAFVFVPPSICNCHGAAAAFNLRSIAPYKVVHKNEHFIACCMRLMAFIL